MSVSDPVRLPRRIPAPDPASVTETDVVIVGTGAAGLSAALHLAAADIPTTILTRGRITDSATAWAQGGLAAVWDAGDSTDLHYSDTITAGAGLCEPGVVRELVESAPRAIQRLIDLGAEFDRSHDGSYDLHLEGGHHHRRILHAGGDASGYEVERTLAAALDLALTAPNTSVTVAEQTRVIDVLTDSDGVACGVRVLGPDGVIGDIHARAVVLASGGVGQLWPQTTNPNQATGDGIAIAARAGALIRDIEFVQFHPTLLVVPDAYRVPGDRGVLISEAVRGEGAYLVDQAGNRVMTGLHPMADLAPRDVVSAAMQAHMARTGEPHLFLDGTGFGAEKWQRQFPSILQMCRERGVDPVTQPIPVHPGAHYLCGGVAADLSGRTTLAGLYAIGEVAATGVQGANRLASNSVTEALVAGDHCGALLASHLGPRETPAFQPESGAVIPRTATEAIQQLMQTGVAVLRTAESLEAALAELAQMPSAAAAASADRSLDHETLDATNLHTVATLITTAALARTESRGCHRRADFPDSVQRWVRHLALTLEPDGSLSVHNQPLDLPADALFSGRSFPWPVEITDLLVEGGLDPSHVLEVINRTLDEDLQWGPDVTTEATLGADATGVADVVARQSGCLAAVPIGAAVIHTLAQRQQVPVEVTLVAADGDRVQPGDVVLTASGPLRCLLTAERTMLNLTSQLSGVATATAAWADALAGTQTRVRDTRKTVPGLRVLQKYAVRCGGGVNHRMGLGDAALIKDNHVAGAGSVAGAFRAVRERAPHVSVEIEVDTIQQAQEAITAGADLILLDNMSPEQMAECVALCRAADVRTEASGGLTLPDAPAVAAAGVDFIAVGALTHSSKVLDLGFDLRI